MPRGRPSPDGTVVVTGAGSGIGRSTALQFAERGRTVAALDVDLGSSEKTAAACAEAGGHSQAYRCDVTDPDEVSATAARVEEQLGPVGVLVNNAGVGMTGRFLDTTAEDWAWIRGVNLDGVVNCCHAFAPALLERRRGHVVNVSSGLAFTPRATEPLYVATKAAVLALSQCLRADWEPRGVGVSAVCPGIINTPIANTTRFRGDRESARHRKRVERVFNHGHPPERVAGAIVEAVDGNRPFVAVGVEARLGWWFHRLAPVALHQRLARVGV